MLWFLANIALAAPLETVDLDAYTAWRRDVRNALDAERSRCTGSRVRLAYTLRVGPDGSLTDARDPAKPPTADRIGPPRTAGYAAGERAAVLAAADRAKQCFEEALATLSLPPPPGGRSVTLPLRWFDLGPPSEPQPPAGAPRLAPPALDSDEVRNGFVEVIWAGEAAVLACVPADHPPVEATWLVARDGSVATLAPLEGVTPEQASCIGSVVMRWGFPPVEGTDTPFRIRHVFDPGL